MSKKKNEAPEQIKLTSQEADALLSRVESQTITKKDAETIAAVLAVYLWMQQQLSRAKLTIKRLKKLFGFKSESRRPKPKSDEGISDSDTDDTNDDTQTSDVSGDTNDDAQTNEVSGDVDNVPEDPNTDTESTPPTENRRKVVTFDTTKNHGRLGAGDYPGCATVEVPLDEEFKKLLCPECLEAGTQAKLYPVPASVVVILHSAPLISGTKYELERLRCSVCQAYFTAPLPNDVNKEQRYTHSCISSIAIHHYCGGLPFKRLETLQSAQGVPLPDATQYDLMQRCYNAVIKPVADELRLCAANGHLLRFDDTTGHIIQLEKSVHTTVMLSEYQGQRIYLYDTSNLTAGKEFKLLLSMRDVDEPITSMSDASSSNFPDLDESLLSKWIICLCLAHGRRRFVELLDDEGADEEVQFVLAVIAKIYQHERYCQDSEFSAQERLTYHQTHSAPLMEAMRIWLNNQLRFKLVEPNSNLGSAILYILKHWQGLTQFLRVLGAPIDNNLCEQAVKVFIRYRKNSLFYRTLYGATIGDAMMSVIQTAAYAGVNIFDYFNALQENEIAVKAQPLAWLPWNYHQSLKSLTALSQEVETMAA